VASSEHLSAFRRLELLAELPRHSKRTMWIMALGASLTGVFFVLPAGETLKACYLPPEHRHVLNE